MATYTGDDGTISVAKSGGATLSSQIKSFSLDAEAGIIEDTSKGDAYKTHKAGRKGWTGTITAHFGATHPVEGDTVACTFDFGNGSSITGNAIVAKVGYESPEGDSVAALSMDVTGTGALTRA